MDKVEIREQFPSLNEVELLEELSEFGIERTFAQGESLIRKDQYLKYLPLILSGSIRIMREDEEGNEVLLYYLESGNTCAMSITCCMREQQSKVWAYSEEETKVLLVPIEKNNEWIKEFTSWRNFIMSSYVMRMEELLTTVDSIAFYSLDERLVKYLKDRSNALKQDTLTITHSEIARGLNSSREAVSRLLKKLENMGKVRLGRNQVTLLAA